MRPTCRSRICPTVPSSLLSEPSSALSASLSYYGAPLSRASFIAPLKRPQWLNILPMTRRHSPPRLRLSTSMPTTTQHRMSLPAEAFAGATEVLFHPRHPLKPTFSFRRLRLLALQTLATQPTAIPPTEILPIEIRASSRPASTLLATRLPTMWMPTSLPSA